MMIRLITIISMLILLLGCDSSTKNELSNSIIPSNNDIAIAIIEDTNLVKNQIEDTIKCIIQNQTIVKDKNISEENTTKQTHTIGRYIELPSDDNWNGKPMTQQIEIPENVWNNFPDTLAKLAVARYKTYDYYFSIAIADNFEQGISTVMVMYPEKLIFRFQLFENEYMSTPYAIKEITVRRNENGEPYAETNAL